MKEQYLEIRLEVPASSIDFSDCGDGCGFVHGLAMARFKGFSILEFDDAVAATAEMNRQLGECPQDRNRKAAEHYKNLARQAREMMAEMDRRAGL